MLLRLLGLAHYFPEEISHFLGGYMEGLYKSDPEKFAKENEERVRYSGVDVRVLLERTHSVRAPRDTPREYTLEASRRIEEDHLTSCPSCGAPIEAEPVDGGLEAYHCEACGKSFTTEKGT
jgi:hypothetical protein